jgi:hypothetical protein
MPLTVTVQQAPATGKEYTLNDTDGLTLPGGIEPLVRKTRGAVRRLCWWESVYFVVADPRYHRT